MVVIKYMTQVMKEDIIKYSYEEGHFQIIAIKEGIIKNMVVKEGIIK